VLDHDEVAVAAVVVGGEDRRAARGGADPGSVRHGKVDALVAAASRPRRAETVPDWSRHRPQESSRTARRAGATATERTDRLWTRDTVHGKSPRPLCACDRRLREWAIGAVDPPRPVPPTQEHELERRHVPAEIPDPHHPAPERRPAAATERAPGLGTGDAVHQQVATPLKVYDG
jgi:hypothetical protein